MPVPVVLDVPHHLLRRPADPARGLGATPLVAAEAAEVLGLGVDDAAGVVVGEGLPGVAPVGSRQGLPVAVAEGPGVGGVEGADGGGAAVGFEGFREAEWGFGEREEGVLVERGERGEERAFGGLHYG